MALVMTTSWYPPDVKPVREGWYEVQGCRFEGICGGRHYWHGNGWSMTPYDRIYIPNYPWRGVKK